jgi:hypothetical protein
MRYCLRCGTAAAAQQTFCVSCGARLEPTAEPQAPTPAAGPPPDAWSPSAPAGTGPQSPAWPGTTPAAGTEPAAAAGWSPPRQGPGAEPWGSAQPPSRRSARRTGALITIAALVLVLGGGAVAGWKLLGPKAHHVAGSRGAAGTAAAPAESTAASASPGSASPASGTPDARPGGVTVAAAASQQASAPQVAAFLGTYFQAINTSSYSAYSALFVPSLRPTLQQFDNGYGSTSDSAAVLTGISGTPAGLAAAVSFTSHQEPADSPTVTSCTSWNITLYLQPDGTTFLIGQPPAGYHAQYQAC